MTEKPLRRSDGSIDLANLMDRTGGLMWSPETDQMWLLTRDGKKGEEFRVTDNGEIEIIRGQQ